MNFLKKRVFLLDTETEGEPTLEILEIPTPADKVHILINGIDISETLNVQKIEIYIEKTKK